ncbi:hypothetical protein SKAU_G00141370 [Synaphobranchus kaupii]|uniref:Uncharacterized protein n=1 Tax=Synaphobranchus kaupii TaxID=118154 RepID=A0A9Q1FSB7_SYNKA|nr:hypothetical protein SKAU_G00141370 [Synaphobranchus kaupii]
MSQSSKVFHVLVEVRSVPEREGNGARDLEVAGTTTPMGEEVRMRGSSIPVANRLSEGGRAASSGGCGGDGNCSPSRSPPISSQHCQSADRGLPCNGIGRLLSAAPNALDNDEGMVALRSPKREAPQGWGPRSSGGQRSVVTFSYIEKASVRTVQSPQSAPRRTAASHSADSPGLRRSAVGSPPAAATNPCKRMSTPVYLYSPESSCHSSPALSLRAPGGQRIDPVTCSITRASTHQASEELRSPEVKRRATKSPAEQHHLQSRCQSWAGTPMHGAGTLPSAPSGPGWLNPPCDHPRNSIENHPSSHATPQPTSATPPMFRPNRSQEVQIPAEWLGVKGGPGSDPLLAGRVSLPPGDSFSSAGRGINQLSGSRTASPADSPQTGHRLTNDATGRSAVFMEAGKCSSPSSQGDVVEPGGPRSGRPPQEWRQCHLSRDRGAPENRLTVMNIPVDCVPEASAPAGPERHRACPVRDPEPGGRERVPGGSPALPARLHRFDVSPADVASPLKDPRLQKATLRVTDSPTLHRHQPPQYTGDNWSANPVHKLVMKDSPEPSVRLYVGQRGGVPDAEAPVSWTSRQQLGGALGWGGDSPKVGQQAEECLAPVLLQKEAEFRTREALLLGPVVLDHPGAGQGREAQDEQQAPGGWNVLQKAEEKQQPGCSPNCRGDQSCTSPESTLSSHRSFEMGHTTSGIQSDSGISSMGPSLHSQKIARAKWEFLFGTPSGDSPGSKDNPDASTTPPSGTSSESPTPTPPTSLRLESQRLADHDVQHVEVELVTPPPMAAGASPKTGIIRRTIKYSETDLDAVPLRCYRETDIDEVLADQDEADSAFGSNRSVPGTPGTSGTESSPLGGAPYERMDGEEEEEEEEEEGEREMLSWSSVRRHGERRRYRSAQEEGGIFSVLMKRPLDGFLHCHPALKSPILVSGPRLAAEDTFSCHFESIMESHRAKGTSYSSLDSEDLLTSSGQSVFTFDLPTLTPEVQCQTYQSAREIVRLSFAPLARRETPSGSEDTLAALDSDATRAPSSERLSTCSEDTPSWGWFSTLSPSRFSGGVQPAFLGLPGNGGFNFQDCAIGGF